MATEQLYGIRDYLRNQGYADNDIGYNNGTVMLKGRNFINATPQAQDDPTLGLRKDSTYASGSALSNALNQYNQGTRNTTLNNTNNQIATMTNQQGPTFTAPKPFEYNPQNDIQYQNALQSALQNARTASNNAQVQLGARGIGNSSIAIDRSNQIQQNAVGRVTSEVLPNLIQQAYQRYQGQNAAERQAQLDNYGVSQDSLQNQYSLANYLNGLNQQDITNQRNDLQDGLQRQQANLGAAATVGQQLGRVLQPKDDWSNLYNQDDAPLNMAAQQQQYGQQQDQIQNEAQYLGTYQGQPTMQRIIQEANLRNITADNARAAAAEARAAGNQQLGALFDVWDRTGTAPEGIPGVPAGTPLAGKTQEAQTAESYAKYVDGAARYQDGKLINPDAVESTILSSNLTESEMRKLYSRYGLKWGD